MADHYSLCLLTVMDRLWFHQIVLLSSDSPSPPQEVQNTNLELHKLEEVKAVEQEERRLARLSLSISRGRSQSSSLLTVENFPRNRIKSSSLSKLEKSMSCRSFEELELDEVKGFMDLGFIFNKGHLNPRIVRVIPGLSRLGLLKSKVVTEVDDVGDHEEEEEEEEDDDDIVKDEEEEKGIIRPYLSEAWLIRRPDSPLLNLKLPRATAASEMKKHLKFWARTVASVIQQES